MDTVIEPAQSLKNLGFVLDADLSMKSHVANVLCLKELCPVHRYFTTKAGVKVAYAMVNTRLDYCNSLLYDTNTSNINRLQ